MPIDYLPILVFFVIAGLFGIVALTVPALLGPHRPTALR
jgi:NADH:ubiquinone oxidoreductase subunit 3 (subunit A)